MLVQHATQLKEEILKLKKQKDVVILAHNYQVPDVQDVADFVGDSLSLSRQAAKVENKTILFCGVHFMAETAAIISPQKKVLIPDLEAGCSLSDSITVNDLRKWKKEHPGAISVGYVNTTAEIKAELDYCCTTSMLYDVASGNYKNRQVQILSTEGMMNYVKNSSAQQFVVATETGILYRMRQQNPGKTFVPASEKAECQYMKMITPEKVYNSLMEDKYEVIVPKEIADKARLAIERMLSVS